MNITTEDGQPIERFVFAFHPLIFFRKLADSSCLKGTPTIQQLFRHFQTLLLRVAQCKSIIAPPDRQDLVFSFAMQVDTKEASAAEAASTSKVGVF